MRSTLTFIFIIVLLNLKAETHDILVNFASKVDSITIDSILAINLTTNQKVAMAGNATLVLKDVTQQNTDYKIQKSASHLFPNPYLQNATLQIESNIVQKIAISISELYGQNVFQKSINVYPGVHLYTISCKKNGIYFVTVEKTNSVETLKIMQVHSGSNNMDQIIYIGSVTNGQSKFKSIYYNDQKEFSNNQEVREPIENSYLMNYKTGNIILIKCKSGFYETIVTASPDSSITIWPEFFKCVDFDMNSYPVVKIGDQTWMAKNLTTTHYSNGDMIPSDIENKVWVNLKTGASAIYLNDPKHLPNYGRLYNWFAVNDERGVCPVGWHVSSNTDWDTLLNYLGGPENAGGKLKATGIEFWKEPNFGATNISGFSALPSSGRNLDGVAYNDGHDCFYWMADEKDSIYGYNRYIYFNRTLVTKVSHKGRRFCRQMCKG